MRSVELKSVFARNKTIATQVRRDVVRAQADARAGSDGAYSRSDGNRTRYFGRLNEGYVGAKIDETTAERPQTTYRTAVEIRTWRRKKKTFEIAAVYSGDNSRTDKYQKLKLVTTKKNGEEKEKGWWRVNLVTKAKLKNTLRKIR